MVARKSVRIIERAAAGLRFFLVATYAPHSPSTWAPRRWPVRGRAAAAVSFDEADVSDKPAIVRNLPPMTRPQIEAMEFHCRSRLRSLQAVDDLVETVVATLQAQDLLDNTYIVYTSDNGHHMGEHPHDRRQDDRL